MMRMSIIKLSFAVLFLSSCAYSDQLKVPSSSEALLNSHSGNIIQQDGYYYLFGEYRVDNTDWRTKNLGNNQKITFYRSKDLKNWTSLGNVLDLSNDKRNFELERPKAIYNKETNKYLLWFHLQPNRKFTRGIGLAGVAIADRIDGPYKFLGMYQVGQGHQAEKSVYSTSVDQKWAKLSDKFYKDFMPNGQEIHDLNVYTENNNAYLVYSAEEGYAVQIVKLDPTFTKPTDQFVRVLVGERHEAPVLFKHDGKYFLISSGITGYRNNTATVATSKDIMGDWKTVGVFPKSSNSNDIATTFGSQPAFVFQCQSSKKFVYVGDVWNTSEHFKYLWQSKYIWADINFDSNNLPYIDSNSIKSSDKVCN
ncbi:MAG: glycoside hydrolase family 43 protein [Rouxiella badensis]|uniref:glycoside hydrolase family 43 protein n=1 Tax=Rouxiella badensis TaxID=1646377 RepID=UPI003C3BDF9B